MAHITHICKAACRSISSHYTHGTDSAVPTTRQRRFTPAAPSGCQGAASALACLALGTEAGKSSRRRRRRGETPAEAEHPGDGRRTTLEGVMSTETGRLTHLGKFNLFQASMLRGVRKKKIHKNRKILMQNSSDSVNPTYTDYFILRISVRYDT